jgi:hypothetical protein
MAENCKLTCVYCDPKNIPQNIPTPSPIIPDPKKPNPNPPPQVPNYQDSCVDKSNK